VRQGTSLRAAQTTTADMTSAMGTTEGGHTDIEECSCGHTPAVLRLPSSFGAGFSAALRAAGITVTEMDVATIAIVVAGANAILSMHMPTDAPA
jgi:hypothetical protein